MVERKGERKGEKVVEKREREKKMKGIRAKPRGDKYKYLDPF
jgi:hypothetical protein